MTGRLPAGTVVLADPDAVAAEAARRLCDLLASRPLESRLSVCIAGGSTPKRLYGLLSAPPWRDRMPWPRISWFLGDERMVPPGHPDSNLGMARTALFTRSPVPPESIHAMPTGGSAEAGADAYEAALRRFHGPGPLSAEHPLFDVVLLGFGPDGHTASLFPGKPAIEEQARLAVAVPEAGEPPFVPRITLTRSALGSCRLLLWLATGRAKRDALARIAAGEPLPAARVIGQSETSWLLDQEAATEGGG